MAELVAGAFLSATFEVLFDRLASREVLNFLRGRKKSVGQKKNVGLLLKKLKSKLLVLKAVLNDAEEKQFMDPAVKDWMDELKHTLYQADDLLDMVHYHVLRSKVEAEYQDDHQVRDPISSSFDDDVEEIESKLEEIVDLLDDFVNEKDVLGLKEVARRSWSPSLQSTSLVDESSVFGRGNNKEEIIKLLLSSEASDKDIGVIPIVGMGGVGKTTLAQLVYNDSRVNQHFEMKAWACVSDEFDVVRVTKAILEKITDGTTCRTIDLDQLQVSLKEKIRGKKFLIVLDDVWNENYVRWDNLKKPLTSGAYGSKIIVTTRNQGVASIMQTAPVHKLQQLSDEDCWALFAKVAFNHGDSQAHPILEEIGKKIAKRCKGLPLAAKTLGGLLRSNLDTEKWNDILESEIWDLPEDKNDILPALRLSYRYLSSHSKQCFAYCSIYPKDYAFEKKEIILLWIAQNLVPRPSGNKTLEKVSDEIFQELVSRSFFQQSSRGASFFVMHDLVHDLAEFVSGQFIFRLEDKKLCNIPEKVHHLSHAKHANIDAEIFKEIGSDNCLRTFIALRPKGVGYKVLRDPLPKLRALRVLSVPIDMSVKFDQWVGKMIHLCYLNLSESLISELPESVCNLYNLETLSLANCYKLVKLPTNIGKLICLRHLDTTGTSALQEMPVQISRLKSLRYLSCFVVGKNSGLGIGGLKVFEHLEGTLSILKLENVTSSKDALEANLKEKRLLQELMFIWGEAHDDSRHEKDVLENLQPHPNVKKLHIRNYGGTMFPGWLGDSSFSNIVTLSLDGCKHCFSLPALGQLPTLRDLFIARMDGITKVGLELYGNASKPFQSLEKLSLCKMPHWEEWSPPILGGDKELSRLQDFNLNECPKPHGAFPFPSLVSLHIFDCPKLKLPFPLLGISPKLKSLSVQGSENLETLSIPDELQNLISLQRLSISHCPHMVSSCYHPQGHGQGGLPAPNLDLLSVECCQKLKWLPEQMHTLTSLQTLHICRCPETESFPEGGMPSNLSSLQVSRCMKLEALPERIYTLTSLQTLNIYECPEIKSFPEGGLPSNLRSLEIFRCKKLKALPEGIYTLTSLQTLNIYECPEIKSFPEGGLPSSLRSLEIFRCKKFKALPEGMDGLSSLRKIYICGCPEIESFPKGGLPCSLTSLGISYCKRLVDRQKEWSLQRLSSLKEFAIQGEDYDLESFPEEGLLPFTLQSLIISGISNLKSLVGLQLLRSLEKLHISDCPKLKSLPEEGLPASLNELLISRCPLLKPRCQREKGKDWHKIAHIPSLRMGFI